jgi:cation diffusion facilitator CzcD-associated flavoprotein CzcO
MTESIDTVVFGGGQAGLAMSYHLSRRRREHLVLERGRVARTLAQRTLGLASFPVSHVDDWPARTGSRQQ